VIAGAIVGVVALPLSMAFAIASGARPEQGLEGFCGLPPILG
jgi:SulP family sulfate permease